KFENNEVKKEVFELGRHLFYEPMLSKDNTISCGSCHQQFAAFAHAEHKFSHGINDLVGTRNSPALFNIPWQANFMHDGGINHIEVQPIAPIQNPIEMAELFSSVLSKLQASSKYRSLFEKAYGDPEVTDSRMLKAMAQFMGLMYSYNSKFDFFKRNENGVTLSEEELRGYQIVRTKCAPCHQEPLFSDYGFHNNGLAVDPTIQDSGRARITQLPEDKYKFKTPSLRNIMLTAPYMHDGRYNTIEQCLDHYTNNVVNTTNLDPILAANNGIALSASEKADIVAFLKTLTDYKFINDVKFSEIK
ncbi:MAG: cytochrome-c peroxidase, partial [Bacteroidia bacterium]